MKVIDAFRRDPPALSFEFFPPHTPEQEEQLYQVVGQLKKFKPSFVSVTYGALGNTREKTFTWASKIKTEFGIEPLAHLTCIAASKAEVTEQLQQLRQMGINNLLALRGDPPEGANDFRPPADGFRYAQELITFIKQRQPGFCLGAAGFPEGPYPLKHLQAKVAAGAEFIITQLFFDNRLFLAFVARCRQAGLTVPIIPGLMPITSVKQIKKFTAVCGATIPPALQAQLDKYENDPEAIKKIGAEQALKQTQDLLAHQVDGLHFFVMNRAEPIAQILKSIAR